MSPEDYLAAKGLTPKRAGPGSSELLIRCMSCGDSENKRHAHCYVNREHGAWKCHRCGADGSFADLQRLFGDEPDPYVKDTKARWRVFLHTVDVCQDLLLDYPDVMKYLREERGLSPETIGKYRLGFMGKGYFDAMKKRGFNMADLREAGLVAENGNSLSLGNRIIIPYLDGDDVLTVRGKMIGGNTLQARGVTLSLFGIDNVRAKEEVLICEGEMDTMLADQMGYNACGIPGADTFKPLWASPFESARKVYIALDMDDAGNKGAEKIQEILGDRAKRVELPVPEGEDGVDLTDYFLRDGHTADEFHALVQSVFPKRLYTITEALVERDEVMKMTGIALGWKDFDHWVHPGLLPGQVMVVLAKTGVGKTAWLTQVLHNLSAHWKFEEGEHKQVGPGIPMLVLSLEQTKAELVERMRRIGNFFDPWITRQQFASAYTNVRLNDENKVPPEDIDSIIDEYSEGIGTPPRILILDYLGYWARSFKGGSRYEQVSEAIMEAKAIAKRHHAIIIIPHQVSRTGKKGERLELDFARDSGVVEETADFAVSLWAPHKRDDDDPNGQASAQERADVRLEILKSRHGGVGREARMTWAPASLALPSAGDTRLRAAALKEFELLDKGYLYEQIYGWHRKGFV